MKTHFKTIVFLTGLSALTAFSGVWTYSHKEARAADEDSVKQQKPVYQCSMHPQIVRDRPGNCPICGMPLTRVTSPVAADAVAVSPVAGHAEVFIDSSQQQLIGLKTVEVKVMPLTVKVQTLGKVGYDPDLYESIFEYREAVLAHKQIRNTWGTVSRERVERLHDLALLKLRLAGLSDEQIEIMSRYIPLINYFVLPPDIHWIYADIYEQEADLVRAGQMVMITAPSYPGMIFKGEVKSVDPLPDWRSRILRARIQVESSGKILNPGMTLDIEIEAVLGEKLGVPVDAVFDTGEMQIVFVDKGQGHFEPREIEVGYEAGGYYELISGLSEGEKIVDSATFLIDSESRLRAASQRFVEAMKEKPRLDNASSQNELAPEPSAHRH